MARRGPLLVFVLVLAAIGISSVVYYSSYTAMQRRHDICVQVQSVKKILHDEHVVALHRSLAFLAKHPQGVDGIGREDILAGIHDQRVIVAATRSEKC